MRRAVIRRKTGRYPSKSCNYDAKRIRPWVESGLPGTSLSCPLMTQSRHQIAQELAARALLGEGAELR